MISGQSAALFDDAVFSAFMTAQFEVYFGRNSDSVDAQSRRLSATSNLSFSIIVVGESMELYPSSSSNKEFIYIILLCVSGVMALVGVAALIYEKSEKIGLKPKVDFSLWAAWLGLAVQFWDFASDISLAFEIWAHDELMERTLILICAIGCTAFIVIPYAFNLYVAAHIKRYVKKNDAAATWCVASFCCTF